MILNVEADQILRVPSAEKTQPNFFKGENRISKLVMVLCRNLQTPVSDPIRLAEEFPSFLSDTSSSLNTNLISQPTSPIVLPPILSKPDASSLIKHDKLSIVPIDTTPTPEDMYRKETVSNDLCQYLTVL